MTGNSADVVMLPSIIEGQICRTVGFNGNGTSKITDIVSRLGHSGYVVRSSCESEDCKMQNTDQN